MKRYAIVRNADSRRQAEAYLPDNYRVIHEGFVLPENKREQRLFVIEGTDRAGWTLDGYVIPRYASGLIWAEEIDLSHPILKTASDSPLAPLFERTERETKKND